MLSLIFLVAISGKNDAQINHVEPLNWWVGMKNPVVQLLINGNDVGETTPMINYPGVTIKKISKGDSKNYLFIDLLVTKNTATGTLLINFKKAGKTEYTYNYSLLKRQQDAASVKGVQFFRCHLYNSARPLCQWRLQQ